MEMNEETRMETKNRRWGVAWLMIILVLVIGVQGYLMHGLRQRMDKIEGKSAAHPVASQVEPRKEKEATESQPAPQEQLTQSAEAAQAEPAATTAQADQSAQPATTLAEITKPMPSKPSQSVEPTFPVEMTQQEAQPMEKQPSSPVATPSQKDTARLSVPTPSAAAPAPETKAMVKVPSSEVLEDWIVEWSDPDDFYWGSWEETENFRDEMRRMFQDVREARVLNFSPRETWVKTVVEDKGNYFEVVLSSSDVDLSSLSVRVDDRRFLKIAGMKNLVSEEKDASTGAIVKREEMRRFEQGIFLPADVRGSKIKMTMEKGKLKILLPKIVKK